MEQMVFEPLSKTCYPNGSLYLRGLVSVDDGAHILPPLPIRVDEIDKNHRHYVFR